MDSDLPAPLREQQQHTRRFLAHQIVPMENDARQPPQGRVMLRRHQLAVSHPKGLAAVGGQRREPM
ncbi:hypothetical protein [Ideonella sp. YS5]|uniref:hypothetical protein n=1 Tax=Ideonella sp. YS5 TaxID=3453714 RepID=UPI003EE942E3